MPERESAVQPLRQLAGAHDSEAQIRAILEYAPFELWVRDAEGRCILQSVAAEMHWGDRIRKRVEESGVPEAVAAVWRANNCRAYAGEVVEGEVEYVCDGQPRVYHNVVAPFRVEGEIRGVLGFNIDITERKRAEEALRESEERFRALVMASSDVVYRMNADWTEMRYLGDRDFIADREEPSRTWLQKYIPPDDQPHVRAVINKAIQTKSCFELEHRVVRSDGSLGWTFSRAIPILDANGAIVEWFGMASDVTAHKVAEQAVHEERDRLSALVSSIGDEIWFADATGKFTLVNPAGRRQFGLAEQGTTDVRQFAATLEVFRPDGRPRPIEEAPPLRALRGESVTNEDEIIRTPATGELRYRQVSAAPVHDIRRKVIGSVSVVRDVTARKVAEEALRRLEALNRATLNAMPSHIAVLDARGLIVSVNDAWGEFAANNGADDPNQVGVGANYLEVCRRAARRRDKDAQLALRGIENVLRRKASLFDHEYPCHSASKQRWFHMTVVPLQHDHGGAVVIHQNITDRKQAEAELSAAKDALEQRVAERTKSLNMLHDIASMANQSQNAEQAMQYCLQRTAMYNGWCFGHALLPAADDPEVLLPGYAWYAEDPQRFRRFREATLGLRLRAGQGLSGRVFTNGRLEWTTDLKRDLCERRAALAEELGIATAVAFPVLVGEKVAAVLEFFSDQIIPLDNRIADAMLGAGLQLGRVIERVEFEEHLLTIAEQIQRRFAQDLHDDLGQELTGLALRMETLAEFLESSATPAGDLARTLTPIVERIRRKTRALSHGLLPAELEEGRLAEGLAKLVAGTTGNSPIRCMFTCVHPDIVLDSRIALHLYRIAQEAITNAVRHSGARQIEVTLEDHNRQIALSVHDDGQGMPDAARPSGGMGLRTMRYRAGLIGARLEVGPGSNGGTQVVCHVHCG
jgi:PAS domain S-box-containing protein